MEVLRSGPIYFYALILCIEANLRLEHYPKLLFNERRVYFLRCVLWIPILVFLLQYFVSPYYHGTSQTLPPLEQTVQLMTGVLAFVLSTLVHHRAQGAINLRALVLRNTLNFQGNCFEDLTNPKSSSIEFFPAIKKPPPREIRNSLLPARRLRVTDR